MIAPSPQPSANSRLDPDADAWFGPGRFLLLLAVFLFLAFPGILLGQETFFFRDFGIFGYPLAQYHRDCFWRGELPLWNPLNCCGLPFLAQWNTLTLYPLSLFYLIFPLSWSLGVFNLGHLFLGGAGMYFLARRWTNNCLAAAIAGMVFAFNGLTWHSLMWPNDIAGLGWMPWVVLAVERAWSEGGKTLVWAALAGAMQMLTGAPEIILLTWVLVGILWLAQFVCGPVLRFRITLRFTVVVLLVAGLAAAQLLPFLDLLKHSHRDTGFGGSLWSMPLSGLANFFEPLFRTFQARQGVFTQLDQYWISSYYLGAATMILAAAAAWRQNNRRVWLLLAVTVVSIWMALGDNGHLYTIAKKLVPGLGFMRFPIKFVVLAVFTIPLLAAFGFARLRAEPIQSRRSQQILIFLAAGTLVFLALLAIFDRLHPKSYEDWPATWHNMLLRAAFIALIIGLIVGLNKVTSYKLQVVLRVSLLMLFLFDVYTLGPTLSPTVKRSVYEPGLVRAELKINPTPQPDELRFMASPIAMNQLYIHDLKDAADDYLCSRVALYDDANLIDELPKTEGFYSLYLKNPIQLFQLIYSASEKNLELRGLKDFLCIAHVNPPGTNRANALEWVTRASALPLITTGQKPVFVADTNLANYLVSPQFDPRAMVFLPPEDAPAVTAQATGAKILSQKIEPQRLSVAVSAPAPALVVIAQSYYHPWHAYVDGQRVPLWRANYAFQALQVPAGEHQVQVIYQDRFFECGAIISVASLILLSVIWFWAAKTKPKIGNEKSA
jgi:hypothetical protein